MVFGKTCKYYTEDDFSNKKYPVILEFYKPSTESKQVTGTISFNDSKDYFDKICTGVQGKTGKWAYGGDDLNHPMEGCDRAAETESSFWNANGRIQWGEHYKGVSLHVYASYDKTTTDYINQSLYDDKQECPEILYEIVEGNENVAGQGPTFYSYAFDDLSAENIHHDIETLFPTNHVSFTWYSKETNLLYWEKLDEIPDLSKGRCISYDYYMRVLQRLKDRTGTCENNEAFSKKYVAVNDLCNAYRSSAAEYTLSNDTTNPSNQDSVVYAKACMTACSALRDDVAYICKKNTQDDYDCGSLGAKIVNWLYKIIRIVRYGIPIMLIILSALDYIRAIASDSDDEMKKATSKLGKRLIAAALIFLIPFILDFILGMFNLPGLNDPFCVGS